MRCAKERNSTKELRITTNHNIGIIKRLQGIEKCKKIELNNRKKANPHKLVLNVS